MNNLFRTCALLLLLASCNSLPPLPAMLNPSKLPSQWLEIDTERDTTLTLASGTVITIQVRVPANQIVDGMQLYKGDVEENGINWVDPQPLSAKPDISNPGSTAASRTTDPHRKNRH